MSDNILDCMNLLAQTDATSEADLKKTELKAAWKSHILADPRNVPHLLKYLTQQTAFLKDHGNEFNAVIRPRVKMIATAFSQEDPTKITAAVLENQPAIVDWLIKHSKSLPTDEEVASTGVKEAAKQREEAAKVAAKSGADMTGACDHQWMISMLELQ